MSPHIRVGKGKVNYQEQVKTASGRRTRKAEGALPDSRLAEEGPSSRAASLREFQTEIPFSIKMLMTLLAETAHYKSALCCLLSEL